MAGSDDDAASEPSEALVSRSAAIVRIGQPDRRRYDVLFTFYFEFRPEVNDLRVSKQEIGRVYLVGAGPGDPAMITLRGVECLRRADVVLYDYLVNPDILRHARSDTELICLGKHGRDPIWPQEQIHRQMIQSAREGHAVVRLKGGDPAVFARGADEVQALHEAGVPTEIVPGITTALAASSSAGIPVTHRELASAVALVTGQEQAGKDGAPMNYKALAEFPGTLVFYMAVTSAPTWTSALIEAGKPADTPAAIIRRCSLPDQSVLRCSLGTVVERLRFPEKMRPPVIVIVGDVAALPSHLSWFEQRPLFGTTVMVTRPHDLASTLKEPLAELGANVLLQPAIDISGPVDKQHVDDVLARLDEFDWLVFSSVNGVKQLLSHLIRNGRDLRALGHLRLAAIGPGTAAELGNFYLSPDVQPEKYQAEYLAETLINEARGKRFLLARADRGREVLAEQLTQSGAVVEQVVVYTSSDVTAVNPEVARRLADGQIDWTTITSSAIARSVIDMFGHDLTKTKLASISPITSKTLRECGFEPSVEARDATMDGVVQAIVDGG